MQIKYLHSRYKRSLLPIDLADAPRVFMVRNRTVARVDSIGSVSARWVRHARQRKPRQPKHGCSAYAANRADAKLDATQSTVLSVG